VISLDPTLADPADAAVTWLEDNGYDVSPGSPELLGPYLADGMYLLALRLTKGASTGSIRPIRITYEGDKPVIPIKLTAVAANDDMGVMVWLLGEERGVPFNYYSLELNEAYINWFSAGTNYGSVVTQAADEAGGQGFVTEFAGSSQSLNDQIWSSSQEQQWTQLKNTTFSSFSELYQTVTNYYSGFSGFWDALGPALILPEGVTADAKRPSLGNWSRRKIASGGVCCWAHAYNGCWLPVSGMTNALRRTYAPPAARTSRVRETLIRRSVRPADMKTSRDWVPKPRSRSAACRHGDHCSTR
jgi:hypothetical protein